jgi:hypothetical protein
MDEGRGDDARDLTAGSRHAFMLVTPSAVKGLAFQRRVSPNGDSAHTPAGSGAPPRWVRLTRAGDVLTGQYSADGITWTTAGSESIAMHATIYVGLALTSHDNTQLASATFDNVSVGGPTAVRRRPSRCRGRLMTSARLERRAATSVSASRGPYADPAPTCGERSTRFATCRSR